MRLLAEIIAAAMFLTRVPLPIPGGWRDGLDRRSYRWFPLVGGLIGAGSGLVLVALAGLAVPSWFAAIAAVALSLLLTGALHEDGLADLADSTGGRTAEDRARIMHDSRVGSFGAIALVLVLLGRVALFEATLALPTTATVALVALAAAISRHAMVAALVLGRLAPRDGVASRRGPAGRAELGVASLVLLALMVVCGVPGSGLLALVPAALTTWLIARHANRALGGLSGDVFGSIQVLVELVALATLLAMPTG